MVQYFDFLILLAVLFMLLLFPERISQFFAEHKDPGVSSLPPEEPGNFIG